MAMQRMLGFQLWCYAVASGAGFSSSMSKFCVAVIRRFSTTNIIIKNIFSVKLATNHFTSFIPFRKGVFVLFFQV